MRKKLICLLFILISSWMFISANTAVTTSSDTLNISGYKLGSGDLTLVVTDIITSQGDNLDGKEIDVTNHVNNLLGTVSYDGSYLENRAILSFRVSGSAVNEYYLEFTFHPLSTTLKDSNGTQTEYEISTRYNLGNLAYSFPIDGSNSIETNGETFTISADSGKGSIVRIAKPVINSPASLKTTWKVSSSGTGMVSPIWTHYGAISMTIDRTDFMDSLNELPVGDYKATVEVYLYVMD